jgi:RNA polymerase sigma-70 factor (ECF subfamily)
MDEADDERNDHELLQRAAAGDDAAVRAVYRAHVGAIHRTVARILGSTDPDVEDVVQHVFLAALKGAHAYDGRSKVGTWLVGIASRRALDAARARWRRGRWGRVTERVGMGRAASSPDVRKDVLEMAEHALAALNPDQRAVFVLHEVEGYTLKEIAEMTGSGISTLHARLQAARKKLDARLEVIAAAGDDYAPV